MEVPMIKLSSGNSIPQIGLGTWLNKNKKECYEAVKYALQIGYRHIDTAQIYKNEQYVGQAVTDSKLSRQNLFITTKIWNDNFSGTI